MSNNRPRRTWDQEGKPAAIVAVLQYIISASYDVGQKCVDDDSYARQLFEDPDIGNIIVPSNVRLVFVQIGDRDKKDKGSVVIELPDPSAEPMPPYPDMMCYPSGLTDPPREWDKFGKCGAIKDVIAYIMSNPHVRPHCLTSDTYVRNLFHEIGKIKIPKEVKAVFVPAGEKLSKEFGSLVIECPPPGKS